MNSPIPSGRAAPMTSDQPGNAEAPHQPMSPGDEAPEGTPGTGPNVCPDCGGSGKVRGQTCPTCEGTGEVTVGIGGA